jgi:hypothetical protein
MAYNNFSLAVWSRLDSRSNRPRFRVHLHTLPPLLLPSVPLTPLFLQCYSWQSNAVINNILRVLLVVCTIDLIRSSVEEGVMQVLLILKIEDNLVWPKSLLKCLRSDTLWRTLFFSQKEYCKLWIRTFIVVLIFWVHVCCSICRRLYIVNIIYNFN